VREVIMNLTEIRNRAAELGLAGVARLRKAELIQAIQRAEGNNACYGAEWRQSCGEVRCCWRSDCLKE
jgi:hypothetical protein